MTSSSRKSASLPRGVSSRLGDSTSLGGSNFSSSISRRTFTESPQPSAKTPVGDKIDVKLNKGPLGLGFCVEGGQGSLKGDVPITVKRLFAGKYS